MTPPKCLPLKNKRSAVQEDDPEYKNSTIRVQEALSGRSQHKKQEERSLRSDHMELDDERNDVDVTTDRLFVFDVDDPVAFADSKSATDGILCLDFASALVFICLTILLLTTMFISCYVMCIRSNRRLMTAHFPCIRSEDTPVDAEKDMEESNRF